MGSRFRNANADSEARCDADAEANANARPITENHCHIPRKREYWRYGPSQPFRIHPRHHHSKRPRQHGKDRLLVQRLESFGNVKLSAVWVPYVKTAVDVYAETLYDTAYFQSSYLAIWGANGFVQSAEKAAYSFRKTFGIDMQVSHRGPPMDMSKHRYRCDGDCSQLVEYLNPSPAFFDDIKNTSGGSGLRVLFFSGIYHYQHALGVGATVLYGIVTGHLIPNSL